MRNISGTEQMDRGAMSPGSFFEPELHGEKLHFLDFEHDRRFWHTLNRQAGTDKIQLAINIMIIQKETP